MMRHVASGREKIPLEACCCDLAGKSVGIFVSAAGIQIFVSSTNAAHLHGTEIKGVEVRATSARVDVVAQGVWLVHAL
jgi:hypothetical protein